MFRDSLHVLVATILAAMASAVPYGVISSRWERSGDNLKMFVTVLEPASGHAVMKVAAGRYGFSCRMR